MISSEREPAANDGIFLPATCVKPFPDSPSSDQVQIAEYPVSLKSTCLEKQEYQISVMSTSLEKLESPASLKSTSLEKLDYPASVKLSTSLEQQKCPVPLKSTSLEKLESPVTLKLTHLEQPESPVTLKSTNLEKLPPYEHPHAVRNSSRVIFPARHRKGASATVLGAASAAFPSLSVIGKALTGGEGDLDDPVVWPLVQPLKSTTMATLEVSSEAQVPGKKKKKEGKKMMRLSRKSLKKSFQTKEKKKRKKNSCVIHAQSPSVL